jgi:hypothetical protein
MNAVFTIAAKNYLPHAFTLGTSIKKHDPDVSFHIFLADEPDELQKELLKDFDIILTKDIGIPKFTEMAFKYNVIEFCTSVKPFCFEYLFNIYNYNKIIYIDPDIYLYERMDDAWQSLDNNFVVITPHISKPYIEYDGATSEEELLFVGIYNLGFIGLSNKAEAKQMLSWWGKKLENQCFADKIDSLHVDQRWIDFLPALYENGVKILRHPGYNAAMWNLHERKFNNASGKYIVNSKYPLIMFHFSGLVPQSYELICRKQTKYTLNNRPELRELFEEYVNALVLHGYYKMKDLKYSYGFFDNGYIITTFQRRLFRGKIKEGNNYSSPFSTQGEWYNLLKKNKLIIYKTDNAIDNISKLQIPNYNRNSKLAYKFARLIKNILGIEKYYILLRFVFKHIRFEEQLFLINEK